MNTKKMYVIFGEWRQTCFDGWHTGVSRKVYKTYEEAEKDIPNYLQQVVDLSIKKDGLIILVREGAKGRVLDIDVPLD